jgi:hypothetical protein
LSGYKEIELRGIQSVDRIRLTEICMDSFEQDGEQQFSMESQGNFETLIDSLVLKRNSSR